MTTIPNPLPRPHPPSARVGPPRSETRGRRARRWAAGALAPLLAAGGGVLLPSSASAAVDPNRSLEADYGIDMVILGGYAPRTPVTVDVLRDGAVIGSVTRNTLSDGTLEIHHLGSTDCWGPPYTPDIEPGDTIRATQGTAVDTTVARNIFIDTENVQYDADAGTITVSGHFRSLPDAPIDPADDALNILLRLPIDVDPVPPEGPGQSLSREDRVGDEVNEELDAEGNFTHTFSGYSENDIESIEEIGPEVIAEWGTGAIGEADPNELTVYSGQQGPLAGCPPFAPADQVAPTAPTGVRVVPVGDDSARITWTAATDLPADIGGVTGYTIYRDGEEVGSTRMNTAGTVPTTFTDGPVDNGVYRYTVAAHDATPNLGPQSAETPDSSVTVGGPAVVTGVTAEPDVSSARVSWTPSTSPGVIGYQVRAFDADGVEVGSPRDAAASPFTVDGLTNGVPYTFKVAAVNGVGTGAWSAASAPVVPTGDPEAPTAPADLTAEVTGTSVALSWTASTDNTGVTGYQVLRGTTVVGTVTTGTTFTDTNVPYGTHGYTVRAFDEVGNFSPASGAASAAVVAAPGAPTIGAPSAGNASATVRWTAPSDNGSAITGYEVRTYAGAAGTTVLSRTAAGASATSVVVPNLTNGTSYTFRVVAINAVGESAASARSAAVTPVAPVPGAPTGVTATAGEASATVEWTAPASDGGSVITSYQVEVRSGTTVVRTVTGISAVARSTVVGSLTNGTSYTFAVRAVNSAGPGALSTASNAVTPGAPRTVPDAPTDVTATAGNASATVTWTPGADGGSAVTSWRVQVRTGTTLVRTVSVPAANGTSTVVTALTNGTAYNFRVRAVNAVGTGPLSAASAAVTPRATTTATVPAAPTAVTATAGSASATVRWTPGADGGSAVTSWRVQVRTGTTIVRTVTGIAAGATSTVVTGLTNGTAYNFRVRAVNAVGVGALSAASAAVTPTGTTAATAPDAPVIGTAAAGVTGGAVTATARWTPPTSDGGSAITGYVVRALRMNANGTVASTTVSAVQPAGARSLQMTVPAGNYRFTVQARNAIGTGPQSARSNQVVAR